MDLVAGQGEFEDRRAFVVVSHNQNYASMNLEVLTLSSKPTNITEDIFLINENDDDLPKTLEAYAMNLGPRFYTAEQNHQIGSTLSIASTLARAKRVTHEAKCYPSV